MSLYTLLRAVLKHPHIRNSTRNHQRARTKSNNLPNKLLFRGNLSTLHLRQRPSALAQLLLVQYTFCVLPELPKHEYSRHAVPCFVYIKLQYLQILGVLRVKILICGEHRSSKSSVPRVAVQLRKLYFCSRARAQVQVVVQTAVCRG